MFDGYVCWLHEGPEGNGSHKLMLRVSFIPRDLQLMDAVVNAYRRSAVSGLCPATTEKDWAASKGLEIYERGIEKVENRLWKGYSTDGSLLHLF